MEFTASFVRWLLLLTTTTTITTGGRELNLLLLTLIDLSILEWCITCFNCTGEICDLLSTTDPGASEEAHYAIATHCMPVNKKTAHHALVQGHRKGAIRGRASYRSVLRGAYCDEPGQSGTIPLSRLQISLRASPGVLTCRLWQAVPSRLVSRGGASSE